MGLDMYLNRVPKCESIEELNKLNDRIDEAYANGNLAAELTKIRKEKDRIYDIPFKIEGWCDVEQWKSDKENWGHPICLGIRIAYWRKFNALHAWMVKNVQNDEDDCGEYIVTEEHLKKLQGDLSSITEENAKDVLPVKPGFFFGGTDYDEWYWKEVESLKCTINHLIDQQEREFMYVYSSSW